MKFRRSDDCFKTALDKSIKVKNKLISDSLNCLEFHVGSIPVEIENRLAADMAEHRKCSKSGKVNSDISDIFPDGGSIAETSEFYLQLSAFNLPPSHF